MKRWLLFIPLIVTASALAHVPEPRFVFPNLSLSGGTRYIYDGRRVIQERNASGTPQVSYTRGTDLSGSLEGAGGIGGLLGRTDSSGSTFYHADGGGNITYLVTSGQALAARYDYDPFGNTLATGGSLVQANVYRFSSKERHGGSGMYYYGFRFYDPNLQRWLNRDPIGEWGGLNLYSFVANKPAFSVDAWGFTIWKCTRTTSGPPFDGVGRHSYLWDDRPGPRGNRSCGMEAPCQSWRFKGNVTSGPTDAGPISRGDEIMPVQPYSLPGATSHFNSQTDCKPVVGSDGFEDTIMNYCGQNVNKKVDLFCPMKNDCHNAADEVLADLGYNPPPMSRWNYPSEPSVLRDILIRAILTGIQIRGGFL